MKASEFIPEFKTPKKVYDTPDDYVKFKYRDRFKQLFSKAPKSKPKKNKKFKDNIYED